MPLDQKLWNQNIQLLRTILESKEPLKGTGLFLDRHAAVHPSDRAQPRPLSMVDEIFENTPESQFRRIPESCEHSVAWCLYHIARCEDVTMNLLVAGESQVLNQDGWLLKMKSTVSHTGNEMSREEIASLSNQIDIKELQGYCLAVSRRTCEIVKKLQPQDYQRKVDPARIQRVWDEGAAVKAAGYIVDYWSKRRVSGLLLMPATRHWLVHLNEIKKLKNIRS